MKTERIFLRTLERQDLDFLLDLENNPENWLISQTRVPFSEHLLMQYIESAQDIFLTNQIRFVICSHIEKLPVGAIDVFDYDPINQRAGIGIIIHEPYRKKGYASEALSATIHYCFEHLILENIYCNIIETNQESLHLFKKHGFETIGIKKNWYRTAEGWENEVMLQLQTYS